MSSAANVAPAPEGVEPLDNLTRLAWLSYCRAQHGEFLHAQQHLGMAVDTLLRLLLRHGAATDFARINHAAPRQGLERIAPQLAHELLAVMLGTVDAPEARLLGIAERHLAPLAPSLAWREVATARALILDGTLPLALVASTATPVRN